MVAGLIGLLSASSLTVFGGRRAVRRQRTSPPVAEAQITETSTTEVQSPSVDAPLALSSSAPRIDPQQAIADIMALRAAHGGVDPEVDAEFAGALQRLISEEHGTLPAGQTFEDAPPIVGPVAAPVAENASVSALRASAQHFDARAAEFEAKKQYAQADAARATARELWQEARRLDP
jgi:hypothetical protein